MLEPEWDVLHEIQWTYSKQLHGGTIVHTEGHQDNKAKYETLPLLAQLNIDANELAGKYQDHHGCARTPSRTTVSPCVCSGPYSSGDNNVTFAVQVTPCQNGPPR